MYQYIKGIITEINAKFITVECGKIGYMIYTPNPFSFTQNTDVTIYTYLHVREDVFDLYGFASKNERDLFYKLISVKGLGPKSALAILASGDISTIISSIEKGDAKHLQKFPGVGPKASQQIILDLRGKLDFNEQPKEKVQSENVTKALEALKNLGYKQTELKKVVDKLEANSTLDVSTLIKLALKNLY